MVGDGEKKPGSSMLPTLENCFWHRAENFFKKIERKTQGEALKSYKYLERFLNFRRILMCSKYSKKYSDICGHFISLAAQEMSD